MKYFKDNRTGKFVKTRYSLFSFLAFLVLGFILFCCFKAVKQYNLNSFNTILYTAVFLYKVLLLIYFIYFLYLFLAKLAKIFVHGSLSLFLDECRLKKNIEKSFIDSMSLNKALQTRYVYTPKLDIYFLKDKDKISVHVDRLINMNDIELLATNISVAFNFGKYKNYSVVSMIEKDDYTGYVFFLEDVTTKKTLVPKNIVDLIDEDLYCYKVQKDLIWNMNKQPHLLVAGKTGSGKSTLLLSFILQCFYKGIELYIVDPKHEYNVFGFYKENIISDSNIVISKLGDILSLLNEREKIVSNSSKDKIGVSAYDLNINPLVILIDEYSALVSSFDSKERKIFDSIITQIVQKGRSSGVFLVVGMQNANSEYIKVAIRNQFGFRILLGNSTTEDIQFIFGSNNETVKKSVDKFTGYYTLDGVTAQPQKLFVPDLHKFGLNKVETFKNAYEFDFEK